MTSEEGIALADSIIENDPRKAGPLIKLLFAFRGAGSDPLAEIMTDGVLARLYAQTEHYEFMIEKFATEPDKRASSFAA